MKALALGALAGALAAGCHSGPTFEKLGPHPVVVLHTSFGDITVELNRERAPKSVDNFLRYATERFYDTTIFHRVLPGQLIQGGGFTAGLVQKPEHDPVRNESRNGLKNVRGAVALARRTDPNSAQAEFFIDTVDNPQFDYPNNGGYAVFGKVTAGMDIVDEIQSVPTQTVGAWTNVPVNPVVIESITVK